MTKSALELLDTADVPIKESIQAPQSSEVKSALSLLESEAPVTKTVPVEPQSTVNVNAYDPIALFSRLGPKVPEVPPAKEPPKLSQGGRLGEIKEEKRANDLAFDVLKNQYPIASTSYLLQATNNMGGVVKSPDLSDAIKAGFRQSVMGKRGVALGYKDEFNLTSEQYSSLSGPAKFAYSLAAFGGDIPAFVFGGLVGSTVGGPVGAMGGAFAMAEGLRSYYDQMIEKGEIRNATDLLKVINDVGIAEVKGMVTGKLTAEAGVVGGKAAGGLGRLMAEAGTLTAVPPIMESRLPSVEDYYNTASFLLGMNMIVKGPSTVGKMRKLFVKTGMTPKEVIDEVKVNSELGKALTDESVEIPEEVLAKAKAKVDAAVKVQADLAEAEKIAKNPPTAEEIVKGELKTKGKKIKKAKGEIKEEEKAEAVDESVSSLNRLGYDEVDIQGMSKASKQLILDQQIKKVKSATELIEPKYATPEEVKKSRVMDRAIDIEPDKVPDNLLNEVVDRIYQTYKDFDTLSEIDPEGTMFNNLDNVKKRQIIKDFSDANGEDISLMYDVFKDMIPKQSKKRAIVSTPEQWQVEADKVEGVKFNGMQERGKKPAIPLFTLDRQDIEKTTFAVGPGETLQQAVERKYEQAKKAKAEPITDVDLQTGTPLPKELSPSQHPFRDKSPEHTNEMSRIYRERIKNADVDPEVFTRYLINEMNRYLNGEEPATPIEKVRNALSQAAVNAENAKSKFDTAKDFKEWKDTVTEAARWARESDRLTNKPTNGITLSMGVDPTEATRQIKALFKPVVEFFKEFDESINTKKFDLAYAIKQLKLDAGRGLVDQSEHLLKEVRRLYPKESQHIIDRQRSASNGKGYGELEYKQMSDEIFSGKTDAQVRLINAYILARRFKDIYGYRTGKEYRHQPGYGPDQTTGTTTVIEMVKDMPEGVWSTLLNIPEVKTVLGKATPKDMADAVRSGEAFFEWHRKIVDDLVEAGMKTEVEGELLKAHDYRKFKTISIEKLYDFDYNIQLKGETIRSTNSGVDSLGHGSTKILDPDARLSAHEMAVRAYGSIANQAAKLEWLRLAEQYPDNQIVSTKQVGGWSPMPYFDKGVRKNIYFNPTAAKYLITRSHDVSNRLSTVLRTLTLSPLTRSLAVGTSPIWSTFIGLPMDIMHSLWSAKVWEADANKTRLSLAYPFYETTKGDYKRVYSPYNPLSPLQLGVDMAKTFTDVYTRGPLFTNMAKHGLAMPFLSMRENRYVKGAKPPGEWAKLLDILSYHGVSMETWLRASVANRVIENRARQLGMTKEEALKNDDVMYEAVHSARDRMDYNQGGWITKALDQNGMIFLNAAMLGTRTFWRSAVENPLDFAVRSAQLVALASGITAMAWSHYGNVMQDVPTEGNEKNIVFPLFPDWLSFEDSNGDTRYFYAKLRMDPGPAFMYKMADNLTRTYLFDKKIIEQEPNYHKVTDSLKQLGPTQLSMPPSIQAGYDYATNYSWWQGRQMYTDLGGRALSWPKSRVEGQDDNQVAQMAKDVGGVTGLSPKRLQGAIGNVIPSNNEFVYMFGRVYEEAFSDVPKELRVKPWLQTLAEIPGFNRVIGITSPGYSRKQIVDPINDEVEFKNVVINSKFDTLAENYLYHGVGDEATVKEYMREQNRDTHERLRNEYDFMKKIRNLEHRNFWLGLKRKSTEVKARAYVQMLDTASSEEYSQLMSEKRIVQQAGGVFSDNFNYAVSRIRAGVE